MNLTNMFKQKFPSDQFKVKSLKAVPKTQMGHRVALLLVSASTLEAV